MNFDMHRIGRTIAGLRREHNMTQMALADAMGVSFQAVSNWERGQSMPDISKLPELAALFGTTIDELLGRRCPVIEEAAAGRLDAHLRTAAVTPEEAADAAPLLSPEQAEALADHAVRSVGADAPVDLAALLPFMSVHQVDSLLQKRLPTGHFAELLPFCSDDAIDAAFQARLESGESTAVFLPFMPQHIIDQCALEKSERGKAFAEYLPFLSDSMLMRILRQRIAARQSVNMLLPFLPAEAISQMAQALGAE